MNEWDWRYGLDAESNLADPATLENADWPISPRERSRLVQTVVDVFDDWIATISDEEDRRVLELAAAAILGSLAKVAVLAQEARAAGGGCYDPIAFIWGGPAVAGPARRKAAMRSLSTVRDVKTTLKMFGLHKGALALARGDRWLVRPSPLLLEAARSESLSFVAKGLSSLDEPSEYEVSETDRRLAFQLRQSVLDRLVPESNYSSVFRAAFSSRLQGELSRARHSLSKLRFLRRLPLVLWAGSGGNHMVRALGLEIRRRGGIVRRFVHGGGFGLDGYGRCRMMIEACGANEIMLPTQALARRLPDSGYATNSAFSGPSFLGWRGDPQFRAVPARRASGSVHGKAVYMGSIYTSTQIHVPPVPPARLYLAWQVRLMTALDQMGHDVLSRPHPENVILHDRQPLERFMPISRAPFPEVLANASLMIFDYCFSTAFWEALCSDVPIVYLDLIGARFQPEIREALSRRVSIVDVAYDAHNRPVIEPDRISEAISMAMRRTDPGEFRALLAGVPQ